MLRATREVVFAPADWLVRRFPVLLSTIPIALVALLVLWPDNSVVLLVFSALGAGWITLLCRHDRHRAQEQSNVESHAEPVTCRRSEVVVAKSS